MTFKDTLTLHQASYNYRQGYWIDDQWMVCANSIETIFGSLPQKLTATVSTVPFKGSTLCIIEKDNAFYINRLIWSPISSLTVRLREKLNNPENLTRFYFKLTVSKPKS